MKNENNTPKKKKFNLFDMMTGNRTSKKDAGRKDMENPRNLKFFFKLFGMEFSRLFPINITFIIGNFPIVFLMIGLAGFFNDTTVAVRVCSTIEIVFGRGACFFVGDNNA